MEDLNLDNLALLGPQWWVVRVSRVSGHDTAERMALSMARNFPSLDFKRQINKPRLVEADDMEAIFKQAKAEQEKADQAFEEQQQTDGTQDSEIIDAMSPLVSKDDAQSNTTTTARGSGTKAAKQPMVGNWNLVQLSKLHQGLLLDFQAHLRRSMIPGWQPLDLRCLGGNFSRYRCKRNCFGDSLTNNKCRLVGLYATVLQQNICLERGFGPTNYMKDFDERNKWVNKAYIWSQYSNKTPPLTS